MAGKTKELRFKEGDRVQLTDAAIKQGVARRMKLGTPGTVLGVAKKYADCLRVRFDGHGTIRMLHQDFLRGVREATTPIKDK